MGLDMYLSKKNFFQRLYVEKDGCKSVKEFKITVKSILENGEEKTSVLSVDNPQSGLWIETPVAYWRKANAIHRWFVENFADGNDDCKPIEVYGKSLVDLVDLCKEVLENKEKASDLLPTQDGFFFGGTDYDEYYFGDLAETIDMLKDIEEDEYYTYQASW